MSDAPDLGDPARPHDAVVATTRSVLGRGSVYTLATAAPGLAAVAITPVVTRLLPVEQYDVVAVATVLVQVGLILAALGLGAAVTRQYVLAASAASGARAVVVLGAGTATVVVAVAWVTSGVWAPALLARPAGVWLGLALTGALGGAWLVLAQAYLRGADRAADFVWLAALAGLAGPVAGLLVVLAGDREAVGYLTGLAGGYLAAGVLGVVLVVRAGPVQWRPRELGAALRIGLPTVPHQVSIYLALAGLVVVADRSLGLGGAANVALTLGAGATVITAALNNAWAPAVYRTAPEHRGAVLTATSTAVGAVTLAVAGGVALLGPWLIAVAAPGEYHSPELVRAVALAAGAALPSVAYLASGHLVFARGRTGWLAVSTPAAVAVGLGTALVGSSRWGLAAVGTGYLVTYLCLALGTYLVQLLVAGSRWRPPTPWWLVLPWAVVTAAGAWLPGGGPASVVRPVLSLALVVLAWRVVHRGTRQASAARP